MDGGMTAKGVTATKEMARLLPGSCGAELFDRLFSASEDRSYHTRATASMHERDDPKNRSEVNLERNQGVI
jgi:hypothetical protein